MSPSFRPCRPAPLASATTKLNAPYYRARRCSGARDAGSSHVNALSRFLVDKVPLLPSPLCFWHFQGVQDFCFASTGHGGTDAQVRRSGREHARYSKQHRERAVDLEIALPIAAYLHWERRGLRTRNQSVSVNSSIESMKHGLREQRRRQLRKRHLPNTAAGRGAARQRRPDLRCQLPDGRGDDHDAERQRRDHVGEHDSRQRSVQPRRIEERRNPDPRLI